MHDAAQVLGFFAAVLLIIAVTAWVKLLRRPRFQRLDGRTGPAGDGIETASQLLVVVLCVSGVAALLAVAGMFAA